MYRNPTGDYTGNDFILHGIQISPDKSVNFRYVNASFTVSPVPVLAHVAPQKASGINADLPRDSALYDISVRHPISLHLAQVRSPKVNCPVIS